MRILLYRLGSLGDTLIALPCLRAIRRHFPKAHITWLTNIPINTKAAASTYLLANTGLIDAYISYPVGVRNPYTLAKFVLDLFNSKFDLAIDLAAARGRGKTLRDLLFFEACGIHKVVGLPWRTADLYCMPDPLTPGLYEAESKRLARRILKLTGAINLNDREQWSLMLTREEVTKIRALIASLGIPDRYIVASIGTKLDIKDWEQHNWSALLNEVSRRFPKLALVMVGSPDEVGRTGKLIQAWHGPRFNLTGTLAPRETAAVLRGAELFVGHDSGPMHLAASENVCSVVIFSARNLPGQWFPSGKGHYVFYNKTDCFGCGLEICTVERKKCILGIRAIDVANCITDLLEGRTAALITPPVHFVRFCG